jgi:hypothetical protein
MKRIAEMAPSLPSTRLVYVADREADLMDLMALMERAQALGTPADWLQFRPDGTACSSEIILYTRWFGCHDDFRRRDY